MDNICFFVGWSICASLMKFNSNKYTANIKATSIHYKQLSKTTSIKQKDTLYNIKIKHFKNSYNKRGFRYSVMPKSINFMTYFNILT